MRNASRPAGDLAAAESTLALPAWADSLTKVADRSRDVAPVTWRWRNTRADRSSSRRRIASRSRALRVERGTSRQGDDELAAVAKAFAAGLDAAAMQGHDLARDAQAGYEPPTFVRSNLEVERSKIRLSARGSSPCPVSRTDTMTVAPAGLAESSIRPARLGVFDRVADQVRQDLKKTLRVAVYPQGLHGDGDRRTSCPRASAAADASDAASLSVFRTSIRRVRKVTLPVARRPASVSILDEAQQAMRLPVDLFGGPVPRRRISSPAAHDIHGRGND